MCFDFVFDLLGRSNLKYIEHVRLICLINSVYGRNSGAVKLKLKRVSEIEL